MQKLKQTLFIGLLSLLFLNPVFAVAAGNSNTNANGSTAINVAEYSGVQESITQFLCTPSEPSNGRDVEVCINKMYRFGIAFGGIALVFFLVYAGYIYIVGGESGKGKAKGILQNALIGVALLLGSYVLLGFINPNLLLFKPIQAPIFTADKFPACSAVGFGEQCVLPSGETGTGDGNGGGTPVGNGGGTVLSGNNLLVGDSLMGGVRPPLSSLLGAGKISSGSDDAGGTKIAYWIPKIKTMVSSSNPKPEVAFVILGTNDITSNSSVGTSVKTLSSDLKTAGIKQVVWIGTPHFTKSTKEGGKRSKYPDIVESNTQSTNAAIKANINGCFYDTYNILGYKVWENNSNYNEIHPGSAGYKVWAQAVYDWYKAGNCK